MFTYKIFCLFVLTIPVGFCEEGNNKLQFPYKCGIKDGECHQKLFDWLKYENAKSGIPELGLPPFEPYEIENTTVSVIGMVDLTMVNGKVEGMTNCPFSKYDLDIDRGIATTESLCERVRVSGHYQVKPGPLVQTLTGNGLSGDGNGAIQIDKMLLKLKIPFQIEKREDEDMYVKPKFSEAIYSTNDIERISFEADNIIWGNEDVSQRLTTFMNNNWKIINRSFGKVFSDRIMEVFYGYLEMFFQQIPVKNYISDDLSSYVKS